MEEVRSLASICAPARLQRHRLQPQATEIVDVGLSLSADRRRKAKTIAKPGQGDRGDRKPKW